MLRRSQLFTQEKHSDASFRHLKPVCFALGPCTALGRIREFPLSTPGHFIIYRRYSTEHNVREFSCFSATRIMRHRAMFLLLLCLDARLKTASAWRGEMQYREAVPVSCRYHHSLANCWEWILEVLHNVQAVKQCPVVCVRIGNLIYELLRSLYWCIII